jgi:hypothetical protein
MRRDELEALREQKKHYLAELRAMVKQDGWNPADEERANYLETELRTINGTLEENHRRELEEIRAAGGSNGGSGYKTTGYERSFAKGPLYDAFRSAGFARGKPAEIPWQEFRSITWTGSAGPFQSAIARRPPSVTNPGAGFSGPSLGELCRLSARTEQASGAALGGGLHAGLLNLLVRGCLEILQDLAEQEERRWP